MSEDKRQINKQMAEAMILAKLYEDGFFIMDEEAKTVKVEMRRSEIVKRYKESSYADIRSIVERTVVGLKQAGYAVTVRWLDGASKGSQDKVDEIQQVVEKLILENENEIEDASKN